MSDIAGAIGTLQQGLRELEAALVSGELSDTPPPARKKKAAAKKKKAAASKGPGIEDVRPVMVEFVDTFENADLFVLLDEIQPGAKNVSDIDSANYQELIEKAREAIDNAENDDEPEGDPLG